jgi:hypothetical protein
MRRKRVAFGHSAAGDWAYSATVRDGILLCVALTISACRFDASGVGVSEGGDLADAGTGRIDAHAFVDAAPLPPPDAATGAPDATVDPPPCPQNYAPLGPGGTLYRLGNGIARWDDAEGDCANDSNGTHLVVVDDDDELALLAGMIGQGDAWVGARWDNDAGYFLDVFGEPLADVSWAAGETDQNDREDCVVAHGPERGVGDEACASYRRYVCECDGQAPE